MIFVILVLYGIIAGKKIYSFEKSELLMLRNYLIKNVQVLSNLLN